MFNGFIFEIDVSEREIIFENFSRQKEKYDEKGRKKKS